MMYEPPEFSEFDPWEEFGTLQVRADLFGLHIGEDGNEQEIWIDADEAEKLLRFAQFWLPQIKAASIPKCPACYAKHKHKPDGEMKPERKGYATQWSCSYCGKNYNSSPFGTDLQEVKSQPVLSYPSGDDFDPFLDSDDLP